jgi:hypothetical protein
MLFSRHHAYGWLGQPLTHCPPHAVHNTRHPAFPPPTCAPSESSWIFTLARDVAVGDSVRIVPSGANGPSPAKVTAKDFTVERGIWSPWVRVRAGRCAPPLPTAASFYIRLPDRPS